MRRPVIYASAIVLILAAQIVHAEDPDAILSKENGVQMFGMSEAEWISNARAVKQAGVGDYAIAPTGEHTLYVRPDSSAGLLAVSASYRDGESLKPWKLTVTSLMDTPLARQTVEAMSPDDVEAMLQTAMREMKPEFSVLGYLVRTNHSPPIVAFTIFEHGAFPAIDALNESGEVCPPKDGKALCVRSAMIENM